MLGHAAPMANKAGAARASGRPEDDGDTRRRAWRQAGIPTTAIALAACGLASSAGPAQATHCLENRPCIVVREALYGIPGGKTCSAYWRVANLCSSLGSCEVKVNNELCGDPAPGSRKSLFVIWQCDPHEREYFDTVQEYATMKISCGMPE